MVNAFISKLELFNIGLLCQDGGIMTKVFFFLRFEGESTGIWEESGQEGGDGAVTINFSINASGEQLC